MVSGEDSEGLRHKPRHKAGAAKNVPDDMGWFEFKLIGWDVPRDHTDVNVIRVRLGRVWPRLSNLDRIHLLDAAAAIAEAEAAKAAWNPKANQKKHRQLRAFAGHAAELAKEFRLIFPPPWKGRAREFVVELCGIAEGLFLATKPVEKEKSAYAAVVILRRATRRLIRRTGHVYFDLIADLAWLASGMRYRISERSVRRYLAIPLPSMDSGKKAAKKPKKR